MLLYLLLFIGFTNCCLIINRPITTTTTPQCDCPYLLHDKTSMDFFSPIYPFHQTNMTHYPISEPTFSQSDCEATMYCDNGKPLFLLNLGDIYKYDQREVIGICDPFSKNWSIDDGVSEMITKPTFEGVCVDYTEKYIDLKNCTCPQPKFINQEGIRKLSHAEGGFLGSLRTVDPEIEVDDDCNVFFVCNTRDGVRYKLVLFQKNKSPNYMPRIACDDGVWKYSGVRLSNISITCIEFEDSCNCTKWGNSTALGAGLMRPIIYNTCSNTAVFCPYNYSIGVVSSNHPPFLLMIRHDAEIPLIYNIFCWPDDSGSYSLYFSNLKLENMAISCLKTSLLNSTCYCSPITVINEANRGDYDKKGVLPAKLGQVFVNINKKGWTTCEITTVTCYNGQKPYLFTIDWNTPVRLNEPMFCVNEPTGDLGFDTIWMTSTYGQITNPTVACPDDTSTSCGCPSVTSKTPQQLHEQSPNPMCQKVITCDKDFVAEGF